MSKNLDDLNKRLRDIGTNANRKLIAQLLGAAEIVRGHAVRSIQNQTSGNPVFRYTPAGNRYDHVSGAEGGAPNTDTGNLVRSIIAEVRGDTVVVGSKASAPYVKWVELGNERGQKWPWLKPALLKALPAIRRKLMKAGKVIVQK